MGTTLIIGLSIALLVAVGVFFWGVAKIVYGVVHYYLHERKPERQFDHPEFGVFTSEGDLWTCEAHREERNVRMVIAGTTDAPNKELLVKASAILGRFPELERRAIEFLRSREPDVCDAKLDFYLFEVTNEQRPDDFTFEFLDARDDWSVWRVEFVAGEPKLTGFDD